MSITGVEIANYRGFAGIRTDPSAGARVANLVQNIFVGISIGLARFDAFGRLGFVARIGPEPFEVNMDEPLKRRYTEIAPIIENIVRRTLPWLLSREITQSKPAETRQCRFMSVDIECSWARQFARTEPGQSTDVAAVMASDYSRTRTVPDHGVCAPTEKLQTRMRSWTGHGLSVATDIGAAICRSDRGFTASIARTQNPRFYEG